MEITVGIRKEEKLLDMINLSKELYFLSTGITGI